MTTMQAHWLSGETRRPKMIDQLVSLFLLFCSEKL